MKKFVIIVAAGSGKRFSKDLPKQFEPLHGKPMLMHSIKAFYEAEPDIHIVVVIPAIYLNLWGGLCESYKFSIPHEIVEGGPERFHSVKNGLSRIKDEGLVAVHDGARPLISKDIIRSTFQLAEKYGAVVPVTEISDSIRIVDGATHKPENRKKFRLVQTPQVFKCSVLQSAYGQQFDEGFTDDATVVEAAGHRVKLIEGSNENIKITLPQDMLIAQAIIEARNLSQ